MLLLVRSPQAREAEVIELMMGILAACFDATMRWMSAHARIKPFNNYLYII